MIDRRDFEEWWAREVKRITGKPPGHDEHDWAWRGFMAAQDLIRAQVLNKARSDNRAALLRRVNS